MKLALSALAASSVFALAACTSAPAEVDETAAVGAEAAVTEVVEAAEVEVTEVIEEVIVEPMTLTAILAAQPDATKARYDARRPADTLEFFGIEPGMTVVEALPGGGWYSKILMPYIGAEGQLVGAHYPDEIWTVLFGENGDPERIQGIIDRADGWADGTAEWGIENGATVRQFKMTTAEEDMYGKADAFLFIRALHNLHRAEADAGMFTAAVEESFQIVKPGGVVGIVQHRAPEGNSDEWADGDAGYLKQSRLIEAFEAAGFVLEASSELNANAADTPSEEDVVWRLPPRMAGTEEGTPERAALEAIGESDRMTLRFRKPA